MIARAISTVLTGSLLIALTWFASPGVAQAQTSQKSGVVYVCPMHPDVKSDSPGTCPKCGMALRAESPAAETAATTASAQKSTGSDLPEKIPDTPVYDQNGKKLSFYTDLVKGKTVAIEFIFTTCTTICPPLTATLRKVQEQIGPRAGRDIQLISITVDPTNDSPERLKQFADQFGAGPGWSFITGSQNDIDNLLKALGGYVDDRTQHSPIILIGNDSAHYWTRTYGLAPPEKLVQLIDDAAAKPAAGNTAASDHAPATITPAQAAAHYFPNQTLLTQDNKPVRFYSDLMQGKVVLINFMYTTCTGICPSMTANLVKVRQYLGDRVGKDINIISITVDPTTDTPEILKKYAEAYKVQEPGWYFLTGPEKDVDGVLYKLGGYVEDKDDHSTFIILGNPETGQWLKMFAMSRPNQIAEALLKMIPGGTGTAENQPVPSRQ
jgi:protein SCO1/2